MSNKDPWDEFLEQWPVSRVQSMTLPEYSTAGDKTTFTYWLEFGLTTYGGIGGGSSFKFGIYSRVSSEHKDSNNKRSYNDQYGWYTKDGETPEAAFQTIKKRIVSVVEHAQHGELEAIDAIDLGPTVKWKIAFHYQDRSNPVICAIFLHPALAGLCGEKPDAKKISSYYRKLATRRRENEPIVEFSRRLWAEWQRGKDGNEVVESRDELPLNTIFYGPPGTGKTYTTINRALEIICRTDPSVADEIAPILNDPKADRSLLEHTFYRLIDAQRIAFLTFHPSFSYEDFLQGIRPVLNDSTNSIGYEMKDGVFKKIADAARSEYGERKKGSSLSGQERIFKMSLGNSQIKEDQEIYDYCIAEGCIAHGFAEGLDFTPYLESTAGRNGQKQIKELIKKGEIRDDSPDFSAKVCWRFIHDLQENDLVVISQGNLKVRALGRVSGPYEYRGDTDIRYTHFRPVEWLLTDVSIPVEQIQERIFSQQTLYMLKPEKLHWDNIKALVELPQEPTERRNYVLIIDEINRGNIPRIFGELITLLEPDKRLRPDDEGKLRGLTVSLPGSAEGERTFGVPENLYVIGTMNTADKSITTLDVALRRRFVFKQMYPDYSLIDDDGLREFLENMNRKICALKDKDHQIGHSYFIGRELSDLGMILNGQVLPLLDEYFFGDTTKVKEIFRDLTIPEGRIELNSLGVLRYKQHDE